MVHEYLPEWLTGSEALAHIAKVAGCNLTKALAQLRRACSDAMVECRPRMPSEVRVAYERHGLRVPEPPGWRARYIDSPPPADDDKSFWDDFDRDCEFSGEAVRAEWPATEPAKPQDAAKSHTHTAQKENLAAWMRGYAQGFAANSKKVKREDAIAAACKAFGCTSREAEKAYEGLPFPALRNSPRRAES